MIIVGTSGGDRNGMAAVAEGGRLVGACPQERVTRVRGAGVGPSGMPDAAIDLLLQRRGHTRRDVDRFVTVAPPAPDGHAAADAIDHGFAMACTAYLTSALPAAAVVVSDHDDPGVRVWRADGAAIAPADVGWPEAGFVSAFSRVSAALGFVGPGADQRLEALARLRPGHRDAEIDAWFTMDGAALRVDAHLERRVADRLGADREVGSVARAQMASAAQSRLGEILIEVLAEVRRRVGLPALCVGGSLFYHSFANTLIKQAGVADTVFVPVDPGPAGLATGAVLHALHQGPSLVSPFLGPSYSAQETKEVLDNCKLQYSWESEEGSVAAAVEALKAGRLVGWFDGAMEWGPRALGARCILANPAAPYVLENLNHFLKRREPWRGYALSGLAEAVPVHFDGPERAPFMECDYLPRDPALFRHILPSPQAAIRVQTVTANGSLPRFRRLVEAFGEATGLPFLVNTSFNGFHEPIVCSPRDAVRVFYGTGIDLLVLNQFVLRK